MIIKTNDYKHLGLFFVVAFAFSWVFWILNALATHGVSLPTGLANFLAGPLNPAAFGPSFAAFLLTFLHQGGEEALQLLKRGVDFRFKKTWFVAILMVPFVIFSGAILASILAGTRLLDLSIISNPPYAIIAFFVILFTAGPLQEEFGWRGYALPRLQSRFNALASSMILGFFWGLWHLPAVFTGRFMTDNLLVFLSLLVVFVLTSILFTWIYNNTNGSILAAMLLHASMNWSIWVVMPSMQMDLLTSGFMIGFLVVAVLVIIRIWGTTLRHEKR